MCVFFGVTDEMQIVLRRFLLKNVLIDKNNFVILLGKPLLTVFPVSQDSDQLSTMNL